MNSKDVQDIYPLSSMQQGMLFHSLYAPDSGVYVEELSCRLQGDLDVEAFADAWRRAVERNPLLRTAFLWQDLDEPLQVVHRSAELQIDTEDWRGLSATDQASRLELLCEARRRQGFELGAPPLMRLALLRQGEDSYRFLWHYHHLLMDGWSVSLLLQDVLLGYEALRQRLHPQLTPRRPFRDYIAWLQQQDLFAAQRFWLKRLSGFRAPTPLPVAPRAGARKQTAAYREERVSFGASLSGAVLSFCRQQQITSGNFVQAAWALLLGLYAGEDDIVFGATVSGRPAQLSGAEEMTGLFINTLPVRAQIHPGSPVASWLREFQAQQADLRHYEYSSLVDVQGWSEVPRGLPLFESILVFQNYPVAASIEGSSGSLTITDVQAAAQTNYPLTVVVTPGHELSVLLAYDAGRFDGVTAKRIVRQFRSILELIIEHPEVPISQLPWLDQGERQRLIVELNGLTRLRWSSKRRLLATATWSTSRISLHATC
jgi:hypothetical protein